MFLVSRFVEHMRYVSKSIFREIECDFDLRIVQVYFCKKNNCMVAEIDNKSRGYPNTFMLSEITGNNEISIRLSPKDNQVLGLFRHVEENGERFQWEGFLLEEDENKIVFRDMFSDENLILKEKDFEINKDIMSRTRNDHLYKLAKSNLVREQISGE